MFLGKTVYSHSAWCKLGTSERNAGGNPAMDYHPIQGGSRNSPSIFMLQKSRLRGGLMCHFARMPTLPILPPLASPKSNKQWRQVKVRVDKNTLIRWINGDLIDFSNEM